MPKMTIGGVAVGPELADSKSLPVVDKVREITGCSCTIFQRMNEAGDMLRVCTNVTKKDGNRAIGTFMPAVAANGGDRPYYIRGYQGRDISWSLAGFG